MHILSEDGSFGVRLTPVLSRTFFVFQLKVGDQVLGDGEPAIEWASVRALSDLRPVDDPRLDPDRNSPSAILEWLTSDDWLDVHHEPNLYDRTLVAWGEAMDAYSCRAYLWGDKAVFLFREVDRATGSYVWDEALMFRVDRLELAAIAAAAEAAIRAMDSVR